MLPADRVLQRQYHAMNFQTYTELIHILTQAEKHDELLLKNHHKVPTGAKPLPEVHHNVQNTKKFNGPPHHSKDFKGKRKFHKKKKYNAYNQSNDNSKPKFDKSKTCYKYDCYKHVAKNCHTPKHLVVLYLKSVGRVRKSQGPRYEAHFNLQPDFSKEASCSKQVPKEPSNNETNNESGDLKESRGNMIVEFTSGDVFGTWNKIKIP
jgi:hypothetical protein